MYKSNLLEQLKEVIQKIPLKEGLNDTNISFVKIFKSSNSEEILHSIYEPSLFIILQGSKIVMIGDKTFEYDNSSYFISSTYLAVSGKTIEASFEKPFLSIKILFSQEQIFQAIEEFSLNFRKQNSTNFSASIYNLDEDLKDSIFRLVKLIEIPKDIKVLSNIYIKEILYRLLVSNQNIELLQLVFIKSNSYKISKAVSFINKNIYEKLLIDDIAQLLNMSVSSFHKHFKKIIGISPLQYIKKLKLQEAKRLMILENMDIEGASFYVGYQSTSQFSREYTNYFGITPSKQVKDKRYNRE
jgi:AraC-like DNA-binding protein